MSLGKHGVANLGGGGRLRKKWSGFGGDILGRTAIDGSVDLEQKDGAILSSVDAAVEVEDVEIEI